MHGNFSKTHKSFALHFNFCLDAGKAFTFFPVRKKVNNPLAQNKKRPVQKKAIAKHRAFPSQNAFSIALIIIGLFLVFYKCDRRTFDSSFTIACFLNDFPDQ
jgi:hypothetical protein